LKKGEKNCWGRPSHEGFAFKNPCAKQKKEKRRRKREGKVASREREKGKEKRAGDHLASAVGGRKGKKKERAGPATCGKRARVRVRPRFRKKKKGKKGRSK